jgi:hypothetical protein
MGSRAKNPTTAGSPVKRDGARRDGGGIKPVGDLGVFGCRIRAFEQPSPPSPGIRRFRQSRSIGHQKLPKSTDSDVFWLNLFPGLLQIRRIKIPALKLSANPCDQTVADNPLAFKPLRHGRVERLAPLLRDRARGTQDNPLLMVVQHVSSSLASSQSRFLRGPVVWHVAW